MLRIAGYEADDTINGPGLRFTCFLQGCNHHCKGCHNPETWKLSGGFEISSDELVELMLTDKLLDGVTWSGGDPILQYKELFKVTRYLRANTNLNQLLYTGYTQVQLEEMMKTQPGFTEFLNTLDVIITDPFKLELRTDMIRFRGSINQPVLRVVHHLDTVDFEDITDLWDGDPYYAIQRNPI